MQAAGNLGDMRHIVLRRAGTNLYLEDVVALLLQPQMCLLQVARHIATGQCPGQGQALVHLAAQQLPGRHVQRAGHGVHQRHFHRAFGEGVALAGTVHACQGTFKAAAKLAEQCGCQVLRNGVEDALRRFFVPRRAADGGRLAKTAGTVLQPELNDDGALPADGAERQLVRANGGNVQNARFDAFNGKARQIVRGVFCSGGQKSHACIGSQRAAQGRGKGLG